MRIIDQSFEFIGTFNPEEILKKVEQAARVCYKSEHHIAQGTAEKLIKGLINRGHESVIEHASISVRVICDRGVSHEIVRHRIASYSQESTRYCNYAQDKFGNELTFIRPSFFEEDSENYNTWKETCQHIEDQYMKMLSEGAKPEEARTILPNSLKTELIMTMNLREWRHFFRLRTSRAAHPQIREISIDMLDTFRDYLPVFFEDILEER